MFGADDFDLCCGEVPCEGLPHSVGAFRGFTHFVAMTRRATLALTILVTAALGGHSAAAASADVSTAFGNTVLTIDPDGRSRKVWLEPNGSWTGLSRRGLNLAGKWTAKGDEVCLKQSKPRLPGSLCNRFPTEFGTSVEAKDPSGKTIQLKLVKGHIVK